MNPLEDRLKARLQERRHTGTLRSLKLFNQPIDFLSNDYLGLSKILAQSQTQSPAFGSSGSRLLGGNSAEAESLESFIANWMQCQAALVFQSGYAANQGVFSAVPNRNDLVLYDELAHACIKDGIRLSQAKAYPFKHNNTKNLADKCARLWDGKSNILVATEALFSMDGDWAPLDEILKLKEVYPIELIVDEAHSVGICCAQGQGRVAQLGLSESVFATIITFGKAPGMHGAAVCGSHTLKEYLVNFSRPFIYTTALPKESYKFIEMGLILLKERALNLQKALNEIIRYFNGKKAASSTLSKWFRNSSSPIQMLDLSSADLAISAAKKLQEMGFALAPVLPPTVPSGKAAIRLTLHSYNTQKEIDELFTALEKVLT